MSLRFSEKEGEALLKKAAKRKLDLRPLFRAELERDYGPAAAESFDRAQRGEPDPKPAREARQGPSLLEMRMWQQIEEAGLEKPVREYWHIPGRDFRLDLAWPSKRVGLEIQGAQHRIKGRFSADIEKRALGLLEGWRILEVSRKEISDGRALAWLERALSGA